MDLSPYFAADMPGAEERAALGSALGESLGAAMRDPQRMLPLWQCFSRGEPVDVDALISSTSQEFVTRALASGLLAEVEVGTAPAWLRSYICVVPVAISGEMLWVASDFPWYAEEQLAVDGPGAATQTLHALVPPRRYRRILDLGSGSGALGVALAEPASVLHAIDINPRAVAFTQFTAALNAVKVDASEGDLSATTGGGYDLVVCNPPFVLGRPSERTVFRDADDPQAYAGLAHGMRSLLAPGGIGLYLTNWVYGPQLPDPLDALTADLQAASGCDLLIIERALVTVTDYIGLWSADADLVERWAAGFAADGVTHVGTGAVVLRRTDDQTQVDISRPYDLPQDELGEAIDSWLTAKDTARKR